MSELKGIDDKLKALSDKLSIFAGSLEFKIVCEFKLDDCSNIPWKLLECQGVYFIEIKNDLKHTSFAEWIHAFRTTWEDPRYKFKFVPNLKKVRIKRHSELKEWIPLYIGKSKKISYRVEGHIFKEIDKTMFALKLKARDNIHDETFRLSYLEIETHNYDWVVPKIERTLREKYNPIIGKQ